MLLVPEQAAFLLDVAKLIYMATNAGFQVTGGELYRTAEQQDLYVKQGKSRTLDSNHLRRLAIDLNFFRDGKQVQGREDLLAVGEFWEEMNPGINRWGGNFKQFIDTPHFERNV